MQNGIEDTWNLGDALRTALCSTLAILASGVSDLYKLVGLQSYIRDVSLVPWREEGTGNWNKLTELGLSGGLRKDRGKV